MKFHFNSFTCRLLSLSFVISRGRSSSKGEDKKKEDKKKGKPSTGLSHSLFGGSPDEEEGDDLFSTASPQVTKKQPTMVSVYYHRMYTHTVYMYTCTLV